MEVFDDEAGMILERLGKVREIWRYPISSLGGEPLTTVWIGADGIAGDRVWCLADAVTGQPAAPEKETRWRPALFLRSRLTSNFPEIGFADQTWLSVKDPDLSSRLANHFGFDVVAHPYTKPDSRHADKDRQVTLNRYEPSPLHLLTSSSLAALARLVGEEAVESRRFRPTVFLETSGPPDFVEMAWLGRRLKIGDAEARVEEETKRCGMTLIPQPGLAENPDILRTILRHNRRNLGIYCSIESEGLISLGDEVHFKGD